MERNVGRVRSRKRRLESQLEDIKRSYRALIQPYLTESENEAVSKSNVNQKGVDTITPYTTITQYTNKNEYHYIGKTENDRGKHGMSGSGQFNESGDLVGIAIHLSPGPGHGNGSASGFAYSKNMPNDVIEQIGRMSKASDEIGKMMSGLESKIFHLWNPETDVSVSPSAIIDFLKSYCDREPPKSAQQKIHPERFTKNGIPRLNKKRNNN